MTAPFEKLREGSHRVTWAWLWMFLAACLLIAAAAIITIIALSGRDEGDVALAVLLVGFPALLGVFALLTLAVIMARPTGARWRALRRWALAFVGALAIAGGLITIGEGAPGAVPLIVAGASALVFLALDVRRGRGGE